MDETVENQRQVAFFDLDKTILAVASSRALARPFRLTGLVTRRDVLRTAFAQASYNLGAATHNQNVRLRDALANLVAGWDAAEVQALATETCQASIVPTAYLEALDLIAAHRAAEREVIVVSASASEIVEPIARQLGANRAIATRMAIVDGRYSGEIEFFCYGQAKADAMTALAGAEGIDLAGSYAYSDSLTDLPMLSLVGHACVVNPGRELQAAAAERGWEILRFERPVALRQSPYLPLTVSLAGLVVVALAGLAICRRRRAVRKQVWSKPKA